MDDDGVIPQHITKQYDIIQLLGRGSFGNVYKVQKGEQFFALKKLWDATRNQQDRVRTAREIMCLKKLPFHHIIQCHEMISIRNDIFQIFEYKDTDLCACIQGHVLEEVHKRCIVAQLLAGLASIHSQNIVHRDIKPSNILINSECEICIADFGCARSLDAILPDEHQPVLTDYVATRWYRAPEQLFGSPQYDTTLDIWSAGCVIFELFLDKPLFPGTSTMDQISRFLRILGPPTEEDLAAIKSTFAQSMLECVSNEAYVGWKHIQPTIPDDMFALGSSLLVWSPKNRPTALNALGHSALDVYRPMVSPCKKRKGSRMKLDPVLNATYESCQMELYTAEAAKKVKKEKAAQLMQQKLEEMKATGGDVRAQLEEAELERLKVVREEKMQKTMQEVMTNQPKEVRLKNCLPGYLPDDICQMQFITHLVVSNNNMVVLPDAIGQLVNLGCLELQVNRLKCLPDSICQLAGLKTLKIPVNEIKTLPQGFSMLKNLTEFDYSSNNLEELPPQVLQMGELQILDLSGNLFIELPCMSTMRCLSELTLHDNQLSCVPILPPCVRTLNLGKNKFSVLEGNLFDAITLTRLELEGNHLTQIPQEINLLTRLNHLHLNSNCLTEFPPLQSARLNHLSLQNNKITSIPFEIDTMLPNLVSLVLSSNKIEYIPASLGHIKSLEELWIYHNDISYLPTTLRYHLKHLECSKKSPLLDVVERYRISSGTVKPSPINEPPPAPASVMRLDQYFQRHEADVCFVTGNPIRPDSLFIYQNNLRIGHQDFSMRFSVSSLAAGHYLKDLHEQGKEIDCRQKFDFQEPKQELPGVPPGQRLGECKICYDNPTEVIFVPCGHAACCSECSKNFGDQSKCPICSTKISSVVKIFVA